MAVTDVAKALHAMQDDKIRASVATGDLSAVSGDFNDEERGLLVEAAKDFPAAAELEAFSASSAKCESCPGFAQAAKYAC